MDSNQFGKKRNKGKSTLFRQKTVLRGMPPILVNRSMGVPRKVFEEVPRNLRPFAFEKMNVGGVGSAGDFEGQSQTFARVGSISFGGQRDLRGRWYLYWLGWFVKYVSLSSISSSSGP